MEGLTVEANDVEVRANEVRGRSAMHDVNLHGLRIRGARSGKDNTCAMANSVVTVRFAQRGVYLPSPTHLRHIRLHYRQFRKYFLSPRKELEKNAFGL